MNKPTPSQTSETAEAARQARDALLAAEQAEWRDESLMREAYFATKHAMHTIQDAMMRAALDAMLDAGRAEKLRERVT